MARPIISSFGLMVAGAAFLVQPASAGDRKAGTSTEISAAIMAPAMPVRGNGNARGGGDDPHSFAQFNNPTAKSAHAVGHDATATDRKEDEPTPPRERKSLTFFRFDSKVGNVSVQPVIGAVKGAQFSLGF